MRILSFSSQRDRKDVRPSTPLNAPILWPWILVFVAWTVVLLAMHTWIIGAVTFAIAGGFQLSPLKKHCLKDNRSPQSIYEKYFRPGIGSSYHLGFRYGIICLGSCWALMLVMFGIGVGSIVWMALLTALVVVEKIYPGGQQSHLLGIILLLLAALWFVHPVWLLAGSGV